MSSMVYYCCQGRLEWAVFVSVCLSMYWVSRITHKAVTDGSRSNSVRLG